MIRMFQCVGFQLFCLGAVFEKYFQTQIITTFAESRPSEKVTESSSAYYKSERTASKFSVQMSLFGSKKITRGRHQKKSHANIRKEVLVEA